VTFPTSRGDVQAVRDVHFSIQPGETVGIIGESGSGKSVIGTSILRLLPDSARIRGKIQYLDTDIYALPQEIMHTMRGSQISLIPQNPGAALDPLLTNGLQIAEVFQQNGLSKTDSWERAVLTLKKFLFPNPSINALQYPHQFSGGMRQRVVTGISLAGGPQLLIADEPTKGLDQMTRDNSYQIFSQITSDKKTSLLLITHDLDLAEKLCDRVMVMYSGEIVEIGNTGEEIFTHPQHPYTIGLMKARPRNGLVPLPGHSPNLADLPVGCHFQDRCPYCQDICQKLHPELSLFHGRLVRCHHSS
jgi:peptide/nickel transport system ATP-binding protein